VPINWRFFVPKFVDIEPGLLELFENVTGVRFFETQCVLFLFHFSAVCIKTRTVRYEFVVLSVNTYSTRGKISLFGPAFSSPVILSVIFQVLHFPGLAFSVAPL